jgi:SDR family mycofactocin-dependent oxidoreductase
MGSSLDGKVAFITGAAQGQGRSHAVRLAQEGANIVALDICEQIPTMRHQMGTEEDLAETVRLVEATGRAIVSGKADIRDFEAVCAIVDQGLSSFGHIDIVCANAGITGQYGPIGGWEIPADRWRDVVDVDLTGAWHTLKATVPSMIERDAGGAIVITSSAAGLKGFRHLADYTAAKHGLVGLMRTFAQELAPHRIRVNTVHPTGVKTKMIVTTALADADESQKMNWDSNLLPVDAIEVEDVSNTVLFLVADTGRYITGATIPVDAGFSAR